MPGSCVLSRNRFGLAFVLLLACSVHAEPATRLYSTSIRTTFDGTPRIDCNLYQVDPANGHSSLLTPIRAGNEAVAIVSLAIQPETGTLFGATATVSPAFAQSLVKVDTASGRAELVGRLSQAVSDIGFGRDGTLYGWLPEGSRLPRIDPASGDLRPMDASGIRTVIGGGMAIDANDAGFVTATSATGTLDRLDIATGRGEPGVALNGAPFPGAITNLTFAPSGQLYAVNSNLGSPATTVLVTIDPATGDVRSVGNLPDDSRGLIFVPEARSASGTSAGRIAGLAAAALGVAIAIVAIARRRRQPRA